MPGFWRDIVVIGRVTFVRENPIRIYGPRVESDSSQEIL
jgi:hypothetical protein